MGGGASKDQGSMKRSRKSVFNGSGSKVKRDKKKDFQILLLGAPSVGKSTIFRQFKMLYKGGLTDLERMRMSIEVRRNVINSLLKLDEVAMDLGYNLASSDTEDSIMRLKTFLSDFDINPCEIEDDVEVINNKNEMEHMGVEENQTGTLERYKEAMANFPIDDVRCVLLDAAIQEAMEKTRDPEFSLRASDTAGRELMQEALHYVLNPDNLTRILDSEYRASDQDCLHIRRHTTNVEVIDFMTGKLFCSCTDIGGQAQEQEKWEQYSSNIDMILYVASVSDFATVLPDGTNSLKQQFALLKKIMGASCFANANVIILLNKQDELEKRIKEARLKDYFREFKGENTAEDIFTFFIQKCIRYKETNDALPIMQGKQRSIEVVPTCALDSQMVDKVMSEALNASLSSRIRTIGLR